MDMNQKALKAQENLLQTPEALAYVTSGRGISIPTISRFHIGFVPEGDRNHSFLWWNRVIFPIYGNDYGSDQVIGFSARKVTVDDRPKYVNSSNSKDGYNKSLSLYGMNLVKPNEKIVCLCEGVLDAITVMQEKGLPAVASLSMELTAQQAELLKSRGVQTVYICYDSDDAGQRGIEKAIILLQAAGFHYRNIWVIKIRDAKDVDEALQKKCSMSVVTAARWYRDKAAEEEDASTARHWNESYVDMLVKKGGRHAKPKPKSVPMGI